MTEVKFFPHVFEGTFISKPPKDYTDERKRKRAQNEELTREEELELPEEHVRKIVHTLAGKEIDMCHSDTIVGRIRRAWYDESAKCGKIEFRVYSHTPAGRTAYHMAKCAEVNGLSLTSAERYTPSRVISVKPIRVAMCVEGARDGTWIYKMKKDLDQQRDGVVNASKEATPKVPIGPTEFFSMVMASGEVDKHIPATEKMITESDVAMADAPVLNEEKKDVDMTDSHNKKKEADVERQKTIDDAAAAHKESQKLLKDALDMNKSHSEEFKSSIKAMSDAADALKKAAAETAKLPTPIVDQPKTQKSTTKASADDAKEAAVAPTATTTAPPVVDSGKTVPPPPGVDAAAVRTILAEEQEKQRLQKEAKEKEEAAVKAERERQKEHEEAKRMLAELKADVEKKNKALAEYQENEKMTELVYTDKFKNVLDGDFDEKKLAPVIKTYNRTPQGQEAMGTYLTALKLARDKYAEERNRVNQFRNNSGMIKGSKAAGGKAPKKTDAEWAAEARANAAKEHLRRVEASFVAGEMKAPVTENADSDDDAESDTSIKGSKASVAAKKAAVAAAAAVTEAKKRASNNKKKADSHGFDDDEDEAKSKRPEKRTRYTAASKNDQPYDPQEEFEKQCVHIVATRASRQVMAAEHQKELASNPSLAEHKPLPDISYPVHPLMLQNMAIARPRIATGRCSLSNYMGVAADVGQTFSNAPIAF